MSDSTPNNGPLVRITGVEKIMTTNA